jgi:hypothetical protein
MRDMERPITRWVLNPGWTRVLAMRQQLGALTMAATVAGCAAAEPIHLGPDWTGMQVSSQPVAEDLVVTISDRSLRGGWREGSLIMSAPNSRSDGRYTLYFRRAPEGGKKLVSLQLHLDGRSIDLLHFVPKGADVYVERATGLWRSRASPSFVVTIPISLSAEAEASIRQHGGELGDGVDQNRCGELAFMVDRHGRLEAAELSPALEDICGL